MEDIYYENKTICHLQQQERKALVKLAPYWGLSFDENKQMMIPALLSKTVGITNLSEKEQTQIDHLLSHTGVNVVKYESHDDLVIELHQNDRKEKIPIILTTGNQVKYHLKYSTYGRNLQQHIYKNIWLPVRDPFLSLTFHSFPKKNQHEVVTYLILQFFLREEMTSISDLSFDLYRSLIDKVLEAINPDFSSLLKPFNRPSWPEMPPEIARINQKQKAPVFDPFKSNNATVQKTFNPFPANKMINTSIINPFKRNNE